MGRSRRSRKNARRKFLDVSGTETGLIKLSSNIPKKSLQQRLRNKARKRTLKKGRADFMSHCLELKQVESAAEHVYDLPPSHSLLTPPSEVAAQVLAFLVEKINFLNRKERLLHLSSLYCENSSVSLHAAPFISEDCDAIICKTSANRKDCKSIVTVDSMLPYIMASSNLLKGSWPLPSWALNFGEEAESKLDKFQRKNLRVIRRLQDFNSKYFKRQRNRADLSGISHYNSTYSTILVAEGLGEIEKLFVFLPSLIAIKSSSTTNYDIIDCGPSGICLQYRTLCLEVQGEQYRKKPPILLQAPLVRWVQRTVVLQPPPSMKIVNEIICVVPVSKEHEAKYADVIRDAIESWVSSLERTDSSSAQITEECDRAVKVTAISSVTGMNQAFSEQCLSECDWDVDRALEAFRRVQAAGMLPDNAFS